jgi:DNA-binding NtrC family response regulator
MVRRYPSAGLRLPYILHSPGEPKQKAENRLMTQQLRLVFGTSCAIQEALADAVRYAAARRPVLILGAPGTGKTKLAQHIHTLSGRTGEFVKESSAAIPEHLEVSHLSGHARGAFTGADRDQAGLIERAHRGTFFLDELALASAKVQQLLLHLLDDGQVRRIGEARDRPVDVRFIAATNADLVALVDSGGFRRDLRDRFGHLVITLPSLAERQDEILSLAGRFLQREADLRKLETPPVLSDQVRACLLAAPWTGNIRELEAVCVYALLHAIPGRVIEMDHLPPDFVAPLGDVLRSRHDQSAAERAAHALRQAGGNKAKAARLLGVTRQHFYRLLAGVSVLLLCDLCNLWTEVSGALV